MQTLIFCCFFRHQHLLQLCVLLHQISSLFLQHPATYHSPHYHHLHDSSLIQPWHCQTPLVHQYPLTQQHNYHSLHYHRLHDSSLIQLRHYQHPLIHQYPLTRQHNYPHHLILVQQPPLRQTNSLNHSPLPTQLQNLE